MSSSLVAVWSPSIIHGCPSTRLTIKPCCRRRLKSKQRCDRLSRGCRPDKHKWKLASTVCINLWKAWAAFLRPNSPESCWACLDSDRQNVNSSFDVLYLVCVGGFSSTLTTLAAVGQRRNHIAVHRVLCWYVYEVKLCFSLSKPCISMLLPEFSQIQRNCVSCHVQSTLNTSKRKKGHQCRIFRNKKTVRLLLVCKNKLLSD